MAIARVPGYSLLSDLDRQGIDLQFTTTGNALVYMDFTNFRLGINNISPTQALDVTGNARISGSILTLSNVVSNIGTISNWYNTVHANAIVSNSLTGVIQTAVQPNITGLGTLSDLSVTGNIVAGNISTLGGINITGNLGVNALTANTFTGTILTGVQPYITNLANITLTNLTSTANVSANWLLSNLANINSIYGTIYTANQPYISNLGNINVDSITIGGNVSITGNTNGGIINANLIYENGFRVLTSNSNVIITGDVLGYGSYNNVAVTLTNTGVVANTYGSTTVIPSVVVDSKGRITSATTLTLTKVGNVSVNDTTLSTTGNLVLTAGTGIVDFSNDRIANVAAPIENTDAVTLAYLNSALSGSANVITDGNSEVRLTDTGTANLATTLDGNLVSVVTTEYTNIYNKVNIGTLTFNGNTITSTTGNIQLDAQGTGVVQIVGADAFGMPSGGTSSRPGYPEVGYARFNTDVGSIEYWDGTDWIVPGFSTVTSETIFPDGSANTYTLSSNTSTNGVLVSINGTVQQPVTAYNVFGNNQIAFTEIPQATDIIEVRHFAAGVTVTGLAYGNTKVEAKGDYIEITGNLLPSANVTYDIGSASLRWRDIYLAGNTINLGGSTISTENGVLIFTPAGGNAVSLGASIDPSLLYSTNTNVKVTNNYVNVAIAGSNVAAFRASGLQVVGNISADGFNYSNGVSILDGVISLVTGNAAIQAGLIAELTSNAAVQAGLISAAVTQADANTSNANVGMKGYVDAINSTLTANAAVQAGLLAALTSNAAVQAGDIATLFANAGAQADSIAILTSNAAVQAGNIATIQATYAQLGGAAFTGAVSAASLSLTTPLGISSGGTGGTSSSAALDNLLPSGEVSGYVLKTAGAGSYYWSAETGGGSTVGTTINTSRVYFTANSGQTVYTGLSYTPGAGQLRVYINGVRQFDGAYTETNSSAFTLSTGVTSGTIVLAEVDGYVDFNAYANTTYSTPVGSISSTTVQDALAELDSEKAALSGATFTGNISTSGNLRVTSTLSSNSSTSGALVVAGGVGIGGNLYVGGNLQVAGNVTYFSSNDVVFTDALIYLADNNTGDVLDTGFVGSFTDAVRYQHTGFVRDATDGTWKLFANVVPEPTTTVDFTNANYSNLRIGNLTSINATLTGNIGVGNVNATNLYGTIQTAAQTNITSVGTLTGLTVSGAPVPNANVSVNLGGTSAWWNTLYANTYVGATATFTGNILTSGIVDITSVAASTSTSTGALIVDGGVGIGQDIFAGGNITIQNTGTANLRVFSNNGTNPLAQIELMRGANTAFGGDLFTDYRIRSAGGNLFITSGHSTKGLINKIILDDTNDQIILGNGTTSGTTIIDYTRASTGTTSGALVVNGGVGVAGNVNAGNVIATNFTYANGQSILTNIDSALTTLTANAGAQAGSIATLTSNAAVQAGLIADLTSNAAVQSGDIATLFANAAVQAGLIAGKADLSGATFTGNVTAGNLSATNLTGTIATASQTNITAVGNLSSVATSGTISAIGQVRANSGIASSSTTTGALTVIGGVGITGNINAGNVIATNLVGAITSGQVTTALGYTPYNGATNPNGYLTTAVTSLAGTTNQVTASASTGSVTLSLPQSINTAANVQFGSFGVGTAASGTAGEIRATNNITAYFSSDARFKENVRDIPNALDKVSAIGGKLFDWTDEYLAQRGGEDDYFLRKSDFGVVAQDVQAVFPEAVRVRPDGTLAVDYEKLAALSFAALKELSIRVAKLEGK